MEGQLSAIRTYDHPCQSPNIYLVAQANTANLNKDIIRFESLFSSDGRNTECNLIEMHF